MAKTTLVLTANAYSTSNDTRVLVTDPTNAYVKIASISTSSYAQVNNQGGGSQTGMAYFYGFDFSQIPSDATITSMRFRIAAFSRYSSSSTNYTVRLVNRSTGSALSSVTNTPPATYFISESITELTLTSLSYADVVSLGDNFAFGVSKYSSSYPQDVFGMEIAVTYDYPEVNKIDYIKNGVLRTLIDLTGDDTLPEDVTAGKIFHLATGEQAIGTASSGYQLDTIVGESNVSNAQLKFSSLKGEPLAFAAFARPTGTNGTSTPSIGTSNYYIVAWEWDGDSRSAVQVVRGASSGLRLYRSTSDFTFSYANSLLTLTSASTTTGRFLPSSTTSGATITWELVYIY